MLVWVAAPPCVAAAKGYDSGRWFMACGLLGVLVLAFYPRLHPGLVSDQADLWRASANRVGAVLSAVQLSLLGLACTVIACDTYFRG
jgi:hypothetical protein